MLLRRTGAPSAVARRHALSEALEARRLLAAQAAVAEPYEGLLAPPDAAFSNSAELAGFGYFFARDVAADGTRLYRTDGTPAGTVATDVEFQAPRGKDPVGLTALGDKILFVVDDLAPGPQLWGTWRPSNPGWPRPSPY